MSHVPVSLYALLQFIDLCILLGCDYLESIKGIGPKTALKLIREHENIEGVLKHIKESGKKIVIPEDWPYDDARAIFKNPDVVAGKDVEVSESLLLLEVDLMKMYSSSGKLLM
jgi:5'-3' exonuclease